MSSSIKYRPEIDGLRALAVLSVIIFHAQIALNENEIFLPGGFLGVDVFFVISGYLITSIILRELDQNVFTFIDFYKRRARRILPALFLVLLASIPFSLLLLRPQEFLEYGNSLISTVFFYSNFQFWSEDPYWAAASELKPLLHTWSLAVEEQYYLVIPIILMSLHRYWKHGIILFSLAILIGSLILALLYTPKYPETTFYLLPFRLWELMSGGVIAAIENKYGRKTYGPISTLFSVTGLIALVCSFVFVTEHNLHPYWSTLIPICSTTIIIWFSNPNNLATRLLSFKIVVFVGLISYSLYLWHYPIFSFFGASGLATNLSTKLLLILLTLFLATFSYYSVEKPFRMRTQLSCYKAFVSVASICSVVMFSGLIKAGMFTDYSTNNTDVSFLNNEREKLKTELIKEDRKTDLRSHHKRILVTGDSHAGNIYLALRLNENGYTKILYGNYSISPIRDGEQCFNATDPKYTKISNDPLFQEADTIVISERFARYKNEKLYFEIQMECLKDYVEFLKTSNKKIILFSLANMFHRGKYDTSSWKGKFDRSNKNYSAGEAYMFSGEKHLTKFENIAFQNRDSKVDETNKYLRDFSVEHGLLFFDSTKYSCNESEGRCFIVTPDHALIYVDMHHYSIEGAKLVGGLMLHSNLKEWLEN